MKYWTASHSTFRRNLMLNLINAVLTIALVLLFFGQMYNRFRQQEKLQREDLIQTEINHLSTELTNLSALFTQSKYMDSFQLLLPISNELKPNDYYNMRSAQNYLFAIASANSAISDIVILFSNSGIVLTRQYSYLSHEQFSQQYQMLDFPANLFDPSNEQLRSASIFPGGTIVPLGGRAQKAAFIYHLPLSKPDVFSSSCHIYILFSYDQIMQKLLTESVRNFGSLELMDGAGNILCTYSAQDTFFRSGVRVSVSNATNTLRVNAYLPERYFSSELRSLHSFVSFSIVIIALMSVFLAWFAAWRQSAPMRRLIADIAPEGIVSPVQQNEYVWLRDNIRRMHREHADVCSQLEQHRTLLRANLLERLFTGATLTADQQARAEALLAPVARPFMVGLARFTFASDNAQDMRTLIMRQKLEQALPEGSILYAFETNAIAILTACPNGADSAIREVESGVSRLDDPGSCTLSILFSGELDQPSDIAAAFDSVLLRISLGVPAGSAAVSRVPETVRSGSFSFRNLEHLNNLLLNRDYAAARASLSAYLLSDAPQCGSLHQRFYTARAMLMFAASAAGLEDARIRSLHYDATADASTMLTRFDGAIASLAEQTELLRTRVRTDRAADILDYIDAHFTEEDCSPSSIAEAFSISEKQLYSILKSQSEAPPGTILLERRLSYAANLLRNTQDSIQSICTQAGFANINTFYKAFRRAYAVSPGQYRDSDRGEA